MAGDNEKNDEKNVDFTALDEILKEIGEEGVPQKDKQYIYKPWDQGKNKTQYTYSGADTEAETEEDIILEEEQPTDYAEEDIEIEGEKEEISEEEGDEELPEGHFHEPIEEDEEDKFVNKLLSVLDKRIKWEDVRQIDEKEREIEDEAEEETVIKDENIPELEFTRPSIEKKVGDRYNDDYTPKEEESVFEKYSDILGEIEGVEIEEDTEKPQYEEDLTDNIEVVNEDDIEEETEEDKEEQPDEEESFEISDEDILGEEDKEEKVTEEEMTEDEEEFKFDEDILGEEDEEEPFETDIEEDTTTTEFDTLDIEEEPEEKKEEQSEDEFEFEEHETEEDKEEVTEIDPGSASIFGSTEDIVSSTEEETEEIEGEEEMAESEEEREEQPEDEFEFEEHEPEEDTQEDETEHEFDFGEPDLEGKSEYEEDEVETFTDSDGMETLSDDADVADLFGEEDTEEVIESKEETEPESEDEFGFPEIEEETEPESKDEGGDEFGFPEIEEDEEEELDDFSLSTESLESETSDDVFDGTHYEEGEEDLSKELDENIPVGTEEDEEVYEDEYEEETEPVGTEKTSESIELSEDEFEHIKNRLEDLPEPTASEARDVIINEKLNKQDMRVLIDLLVNERPYGEVQNYLDKKLGKKKPSMPAGVYILITVLLLGVIAYLVLMIMGVNPIQSLQANAEGQNLINRGVEILNSTPGEEASERAERLFNRAIEKNPNNVDYYLKYADMYLRRNEPEKALEKLLGDRSPDPAGQ